MDKYIIIYNAETDFHTTTYTKEQVGHLIKELIREGYAINEIELYEAKPVGFRVNQADIIVTIEDK